MVVTDQDAVHQIGNPVRLTWVVPEKCRCQFGDSGSGAQRVSGDVGRSERGAFAPAFGVVIADNTDDRGAERLVRAAARKLVNPTRVGQVDSVKLNSRDPHVFLL